MDVITYTCGDLSYTMLANDIPGYQCPEIATISESIGDSRYRHTVFKCMLLEIILNTPFAAS